MRCRFRLCPLLNLGAGPSVAAPPAEHHVAVPCGIFYPDEPSCAWQRQRLLVLALRCLWWGPVAHHGTGQAVAIIVRRARPQHPSVNQTLIVLGPALGAPPQDTHLGKPGIFGTIQRQSVDRARGSCKGARAEGRQRRKAREAAHHIVKGRLTFRAGKPARKTQDYGTIHIVCGGHLGRERRKKDQG